MPLISFFTWTDTTTGEKVEIITYEDAFGTVTTATWKLGESVIVKTTIDPVKAVITTKNFINSAMANGLRFDRKLEGGGTLEDVYDAAESESKPGPETEQKELFTPADEINMSTFPPSESTTTTSPYDEETPATLNAPSPKTNVTGLSEPSETNMSDGRPLAQQICDPSNPMPLYELPPILMLQGTPEDQVDKKIEQITHNEPESGNKHLQHSRNNKYPPTTSIEPVIVFTGQYALTVTDVQIPSRGFPLQLTRIYLSGPVYYGSWGYNWDHNYNMYLRELLDGGVAIWTGHLAEDVYKSGPDNTFEPPTGVFRKLERVIATSINPDQYVLSDREGIKQIFERPDSWPTSDRIPLVKIEDRNRNTHFLSYDSEGRLDHVEDHAGRRIQFTYGECGLLIQVSDHTGRVWHYGYDHDIEHLIAVTTPSTKEYPDGLTTHYEYDQFEEHPALIHNLTKIIDPSDQVVVENQYGNEPGSDDFGRVIRQEFGGFEAILHATSLQFVPRVPEAINVPAWQVEVVDPGVLHVYTFNFRGDLLDERFRLVYDGSYRLVAYTYRYDEQGNILESRQPNGLGLIAEFDMENNDPRARGSVLKLSLSAPPSKPAPGREIEHSVYESRYHFIKELTNENQKSIKFIYDYEETPVDHGNIIRIEYPHVTMPDGTVQNTSESLFYNDFGQVTERRSGEDRYIYIRVL